jgi:Na+/H+ antiporter NhaD/arsenite permease-like protein
MHAALIVIFILAYVAIALEHTLRINKSASALLAAGLLWTIYSLSPGNIHLVIEGLNESIVETAQIVFFLMGAMTIVEVVDAYHGFDVITARIKTTKLSTLLWLVGIVTFFLSSLLDNLTTTIVMVSLIKKLLNRHEDRLFFAGLIVIAANAGGAWTPIGDVTTTMLWIGGQITTLNIMKGVFLPSVACLVVPLVVTSYHFRGKVVSSPDTLYVKKEDPVSSFEQELMLALGIGILVMVPIFKSITHLPPFMGMLFGVGILWLIADLLHRNTTNDEFKHQLSLVAALRRIDMSSIIFFIGILLAVAVLEHTLILDGLAHWMEKTIGRLDVIVILTGIMSAVIDNVPLVAASMGMYNMTTYPPDSFLWEFLAYCAGTGGSILIIGSAAGVAAMGLEKIHFFWYAKKIGWLALLGYFAGIGVYLLQYRIIH